MTSQVKELSDAIVCKGISARTTNNAEISHDTAKLIGSIMAKVLSEPYEKPF